MDRQDVPTRIYKKDETFKRDFRLSSHADKILDEAGKQRDNKEHKNDYQLMFHL